MNEYLICNTTREQREKIAFNARYVKDMDMESKRSCMEY